MGDLTFAKEGHITQSFGVEESLKRGEYVGFVGIPPGGTVFVCFWPDRDRVQEAGAHLRQYWSLPILLFTGGAPGPSLASLDLKRTER